MNVILFKMSIKYIENVRALSSSSTDFLKEWVIEDFSVKNEGTIESRCICQRVIKNIYTCRNIVTLQMVKMGTECVKQILNQKIGKKTQGIIKKNNINMFTSGVYINIDNMSQYVIDVIRDFISKLLLVDIKHWLDIYKDHVVFLPIIQDIYNTKLYDIERQAILDREQYQRQQLHREQYEKERQDKEIRDKEIYKRLQHEREQLEKYTQIKNEEMLKQFKIQTQEKEIQQQREKEEILFIREELKRESTERVNMENEDNFKYKIRVKYDNESRMNCNDSSSCKCHLKYTEICKCASPMFKISHIPPYLQCNHCWSWKCRC